MTLRRQAVAVLLVLAAVGAGSPWALPPGAAADVTDVGCAPLTGFLRTGSGRLYRLDDARLLDGGRSATATGPLAVAAGRNWASFAWVGAGGGGVLYALTAAGDLLWFRLDRATGAWAPGSGRRIAQGWTPGRKVVNLAVAGRGRIYVVRGSGELVLYRHLDPAAGSTGWAEPGGLVLGYGWSGRDLLAAQPDGTLYRQVNGKLYWFHHSDPAAGPVTWANQARGALLGHGWNKYDILALGAGVLLATAAPSGQVTLFRHLDPAGGRAAWATGAGSVKYVARSDSFGVMVDPDLCSTAEDRA